MDYFDGNHDDILYVNSIKILFKDATIISGVVVPAIEKDLTEPDRMELYGKVEDILDNKLFQIFKSDFKISKSSLKKKLKH